MIPYILHVALLISVCLLFYKIFLQRETFYRLNRVVLVFCLALSLKELGQSNDSLQQVLALLKEIF